MPECRSRSKRGDHVTYSGGITLDYRRQSTLSVAAYIIDGHTIAKRKYRLCMDDGQRLTVKWDDVESALSLTQTAIKR